MLRVTVTRETSSETVSIGEVIIGKFSGTEQRGGYAARIFEPPSAYSDGIDACFTVRGHDRYQPAMALVASVLGAWSDGRVDAVGDGIRAALLNAAGPIPPTAPTSPASRQASSPSAAARAAQALIDHADDPAMAALAAAILAIAERGAGGL